MEENRELETRREDNDRRRVQEFKTFAEDVNRTLCKGHKQKAMQRAYAEGYAGAYAEGYTG